MSASEATTNIIVALINTKCLIEVDEVADAYKIIYNAVANPYDA